MLSLRFRPKICVKYQHQTIRSKVIGLSSSSSIHRFRFSDFKQSQIDNDNLVEHIEATKRMLKSAQQVEGMKLISHAGEDTTRLFERLDRAQKVIEKFHEKEKEQKKNQKQETLEWLGGLGIHEINWKQSVEYSFTNGNLLWVLIALQFIMWGGWYLNEENQEGTKFMVENFMLTNENLQNGRVHTLLTSVFSHFDIVELLEAATLVLGFGTAVTRWSNVRHAVALYVVGGVAAASAFSAVQYYQSSGQSDDSHTKAQYYGAGGGIISMMTAAAWMRPMSNVYLFMAPVPALLPLFGLAMVDSARISTRGAEERAPQVASHIAAIGVGALYSALRLKKVKK